MAVVFTFAGVPPLSTYKDALITKWEDYQTEQTAQQAEIEAEQARIEAEEAARAEVEQARIEAEQARIEAEEEAARIASLRNPSWSQLKSFLLEDNTDEMEYIYPVVVCADFADKLKRNAEEAGWRCAFVSVKLEGYPDWYDYGIPSSTEHACNAFETTDRGLVFIDCTRPALSEFSGNADKSVNVEIGREYITTSIFPMAGWSSVWPSMGVVAEILSIKW